MKNIVVIPNIRKENAVETAKVLIEKMNNRANVYMNELLKPYGFSANYLKEEELFLKADYVIVLGGDGTILKVAGICAKMNIPVMGINLGKVGFMTEINILDIENCLDKLFSQDFKIEKRMMMKITVVKSGKESDIYYALNDVVIAKKTSPMISCNIYSKEEKINEYNADGLIISTPTGSTGYSLSAGGPVSDPTMELFIASPICAHMLHARPAIIPSEMPISVFISGILGEKEAQITVDGVVKGNIGINDKIVIEKSKYYSSIIKFGKQSFYDVLIDKLK